MNLLRQVHAALQQGKNRSRKRHSAVSNGRRRALVERLEHRHLLSADTIGLYDPASHTFHLNNLLDGSTSNVISIQFDLEQVPTHWRPLTGDWNGDGIDTIAIYNQKGLTFHLDNNPGDGSQPIIGPEQAAFTFALDIHDYWCRSIPLAGDWDGDGDDTVALYDRRFHTFYFFNDLTNPEDVVVYQAPEVPQHWVPIAGDWDGNGADSAGLYDPDTSTYYLQNTPTSEPIVIEAPFIPCANVLVPVAGDWDNDGIDTVGVYSRRNSSFHLANEQYAWEAILVVDLPDAPTSWAPLSGDWDGIEAGGADGESAAASIDWTESLGGDISITEFDFPDVDGNHEVTPLDVLRVINYLNSDPIEADMRLDTSGDGQITSIDALIVINYLNDLTTAIDLSVDVPVGNPDGGSITDPSHEKDANSLEGTEDLASQLDDVIGGVAGNNEVADDAMSDTSADIQWDLDPFLPITTEDILDELVS